MNQETVEEPPGCLDLTLLVSDDSQARIDAARSLADFPQLLRRWVDGVLAMCRSELAGLAASPGAGSSGRLRVALAVSLVDIEAGRQFNQRYRGSDRATNVLSFPAGLADEDGALLLGDLILCLPVVEREATEFRLGLDARLAHLVVHGLLHLLGHTHDGETDTAQMESLESRCMVMLGFDDPWGQS